MYLRQFATTRRSLEYVEKQDHQLLGNWTSSHAKEIRATLRDSSVVKGDSSLRLTRAMLDLIGIDLVVRTADRLGCQFLRRSTESLTHDLQRTFSIDSGWGGATAERYGG